MVIFEGIGMNQIISPRTNIRDLDRRVFRLIFEDLDFGSKWRDLIECADGTKYQMSITEVEDCASVLHQSLKASPSEKLLMMWGMHGMTVSELSQLLDQLHMEKLLVHLRPPEKLLITLQPVTELTTQEGERFTLMCEATSFPYPVYSWFHFDQRLSVRQDGQLTIESASLSHSGKYVCRIHHKCGSETPYVFTNWCVVVVKPSPKPVNKPLTYPQEGSKIISKPANQTTINEYIHLQVKEPPTILSEPTSRMDCIGGHTLFVVKAYHPYEQLFYQWFRNSKPIEGEVRNELRFQIHGSEDAGDFQVRVYTKDQEGVLSKVANLSVKPIRNTFTAADKIALIIGISTYRSFGQPLPAVEHDLYSTVKVFTDMKFKVISLLDLTLTEMVNAVDEFCDMLSSDVYAVFYCAGHGFIYNNQHYLIPWDARQGTDLRESLCIEAVEAKIQQKKPKMLMMFLDICRKCVEHLNPINLPLMPAPMVSSNANKITIYAASIGEQSFEESLRCSKDPRGIFNQYLLEVLEKKYLNAFQVFEALQTKFTECQYNRQRFPQHPEMTINLEESKRSLWDPIDPDKESALAQTRKRSWESLRVLPQPHSIKLHNYGNIRLTFSQVASNVMDMTSIPCLTSNCKAAISVPKDKMEPVLQPIQVSNPHSHPFPKIFRFPNLQRLQSNFVLHLIIHLSDTESGTVDKRVCTIDLGHPLISCCKIGEMKHSSRIERKEPMEHAEHSLPLPDSLT